MAFTHTLSPFMAEDESLKPLEADQLCRRGVCRDGSAFLRYGHKKDDNFIIGFPAVGSMFSVEFRDTPCPMPVIKTDKLQDAINYVADLVKYIFGPGTYSIKISDENGKTVYVYTAQSSFDLTQHDISFCPYDLIVDETEDENSQNEDCPIARLVYDGEVSDTESADVELSEY